MSEENSDSRFIKYVQNLEAAFKQLNSLRAVDLETQKVLDLARRYFEDAKYFKEEGQLTTALISLAYSEGLLDALRLLGKIAFEWSQTRSEK